MSAPSTVDAFSDDDLIERDRWGRPLIKGPKGGKASAYRRASTWAGMFSDKSGFHLRDKRLLALGVGKFEDLAGLLAGLNYFPGEKSPNDDRKEIDAIIDRALDRMGADYKADYGTSIHKLVEPDNDGVVPERMKADVEAYRSYLDAMGAKPALAETFVVVDEIKVAGTFDAVFELPAWRLPESTAKGLESAYVVADVKTGELKLHEHAIQLAIYSRGKAYDPMTGERTPLLAGGQVHPKWGLVCHVPRGKGQCVGYWVNLQMGWSMALLGQRIKDYQDDKTVGQVAVPDPMPEPHPMNGNAEGTDVIAKYIGQAKTVEALNGLWARTGKQWNESHIELARARKALLQGGLS